MDSSAPVTINLQQATSAQKKREEKAKGTFFGSSNANCRSF